MNLPITPRDGGVRFDVLVQPKASKNSISGIQDGRLKIHLTAPPVDGAANKACLKFVSKSFGLPARCVTLIHGETSRKKTLELDGMNPDEFQNRLHQLLSNTSNRK